MKQFSAFCKSSSGFSLLEITMALGLAGAGALAVASMLGSQGKSIASMEYKIARMELKNFISTQFLADSMNCSCLIQKASPATFSTTASSNTLVLGNPITAIGFFKFATPGDCTTSTIPVPLISSSPSQDGISLKDVSVENVTDLGSNKYLGELKVKIETNKKISGPSESILKFPILIDGVLNASGDVVFSACRGSNASAHPIAKTYKTYCGRTAGNINFTFCVPAPCSGSDVDLGLNSKATGIISGWQNFYTERLCSQGEPPSGYHYETGCHYMGDTGGDGWIPSTSLKCPPPSCRTGDVEAGTPTCYPIAATGSGWLAGTCARPCRVE